MTFNIHDELDRWGPQGNAPVPSMDEARQYCRRLARTHYENFPIVSLLLPRRLHEDFFNVYAWCRWADDLGDEIDDSGQSLELLAWWRNETGACPGGRARNPVLVALAHTIERHRLPIQHFEDLISAFEQDQTVQEYESFDQLLDYCRRSANPVGRIVLRMVDHDSADAVELSDSICTGLQLANFWQDVARDFDRGRIYLPREDRERFGYEQAAFNNRETNDAFIRLVEFQVERAREFLRRGLPLVDALPFRLRVDIDLFARGGLQILDRIESIGYRVWKTRPVLTKPDAVRLLGGSLCRAVFGAVGAGRSENHRTSSSTAAT